MQALLELSSALVLPEGASETVEFGEELYKTARAAREELEALQRCRELLMTLELKLTQKQSMMIDQILKSE